MNIILDEEDRHFIDEYKWLQLPSGYIQTTKRYEPTNKVLLLHRLIAKCPDGMVVDHINGITYDNRRSNLRVCTVAENGQNTKLRSDNKTGYKGVFYNEKTKNYSSILRVNNKRYYLGVSKSLEVMVERYKEAALKYHKEYARL